MAQNMSLQQFLDTHKADGVWTHTSLKGGKYFIPDEHKDQFYELYVESIRDQEKQYLTEKSSDIGPLRVDFDFIYGNDINKHLHTREQVLDFCKAYMDEIKQYLILSENTDLYIMEKRKPTLDSKKNRMKSGIHIVVPEVCSHKFVEQRVRRNLLKNMSSYFPSLPLTEPWEKIYDEGVVNRSVPWTLYGSRKNDPNSLPYMTSYIVRYNKDGVQIVDNIPPISVDLMKTLSLVREDSDETPMTEEGKQIYAGLSKPEPDVRISGGGALLPRRGRPATRGEKPGSRASSPMNRVILQPLEAEKKEYLKQHVMNLKEERFEDYNLWVQVGICLHNIHPDLLDVFLDFSAQDDKKYNEADCINKWNSLTFRNDGDRLGEGTLRYWSREDNAEEYHEIENRNVDRLIVMAASTQTEYDVACVIHAAFRGMYICSDFSKKIWYRWAGHIWRETDQGVDLQLKLSRDIAGRFLKRENLIGQEMLNRGLTNCTGEGKGDCGMCDYCDMEKKRMGMNQLYTKLKTTRFKENVMRECRELFFDEQFTKKVDSNKDLIAFNNGVLELFDDFKFREGKPEDYISFTTGIDYDPEKKYYEYEEWASIDSFMKQVIPDPEVRTYFSNRLASCLVGGNPSQTFHILTGSGSNGKSMISNLAATALGDYACTVPITLFTQKRDKSSAANPEVYRLKGRRLVTMQEPDEAVALNTGIMKLVSSGEKMYARDLFKSGVEFEVQAQFLLSCNKKPDVNTNDGGTWRRLIVINFKSKFVHHPPVESFEFPVDETIQKKVESKPWATAFLNYMVHLVKEGKGLRKIAPPKSVMEYTQEYRNENDGIAKFISEKIADVKEGDEIVPVLKGDLRRVFKTWLTENGLKLLPIDMEKEIEKRYGEFKRGGWTKFKIVN